MIVLLEPRYLNMVSLFRTSPIHGRTWGYRTHLGATTAYEFPGDTGISWEYWDTWEYWDCLEILRVPWYAWAPWEYWDFVRNPGNTGVPRGYLDLMGILGFRGGAGISWGYWDRLEILGFHGATGISCEYWDILGILGSPGNTGISWE